MARQWEIEASPDELARYRARSQYLDELRRRKPKQRRYATAGEMAMRLDPAMVQTPALELIDAELVEIRDCVEMMLNRRGWFALMVNLGFDEQDALRLVEELIPNAGNARLVLSMPPQEGKSSRVGRYGVLWLLRQFPGLRIGIVSYDGDHAARISYMVRADVEAFDGSGGNPDLGLRLARNQKAVSRWLLAPPDDGGVFAIGIGGGLTGRPLDLLLIDDPVKDTRAAESLLLSSHAWDWWQTVARPRLAPWAPVIVVATRWHEADLIGRMLAKQTEDQQAGLEHFDRWREVNIPAEADHDPEKGQTDVLGREPGEFMISARGRTREQWEATKAATSARFWTALYQGKPSPDVGDVWLKSWWRRYTEPLWEQQPDGSYRVPSMESLLQSWDMTFKDKDTSDYVVGQLWGKRGADAYLIFQVWARLSFTDTLDAMRRLTRLFPDAHRKLVEDKANGTAVMDSLAHELPGIIAVEPRGGKLVRAEAVSPFIRAGNVHLPTSTVASMQAEIAWDPEGLIVEATAFPNGAHDDQVDATSQALAELYLGAGGPAEVLVAQGEIPRPDRAREQTRQAPARQQSVQLPEWQRRMLERAR
jgi:predicted phage terminase large subunit-like protein